MSALRFNVVYEDAGEGWVCAHVPELPEVQTQGEGLEQAREMVRDAIAMVLDERHLQAHGCTLLREGAHHEMWESPAISERSVVPRHREIKDADRSWDLPPALDPAASSRSRRQLSIPPPPGR